MAELLQPETGTTDPRILRSRRVLMDSLAKLLIQKAFDDISIQEITDEATLNRATFYLHYPDKNALLQAMTESRFRDLIERRGITFYRLPWSTTRHCTRRLRLSRRIHRLSQSVGSDVARRLHHSGCRGHVHGRPGTSWTGTRCRFGATRDRRGLGRFWSRAPLVSDPQRIPAEEMAARIETMVGPVLFGVSR
jgi:AcrR family transcriptional regulator